MPNDGLPVMKALVPSMGSSTQTCSASARTVPCSSPRMPWSGCSRSIRRRMAASASRSAIVTGLASALSSIATTVRK